MNKNLLSALCLSIFTVKGAYAECLEFKLGQGRFNLPLITANLLEENVEFIFNLSMKQGLSLENKIYQQLTSHQPQVDKSYIDLNGNTQIIKQVEAMPVMVNQYPFKNVRISQNHEGGTVISANKAVTMPSNNMGLGLFQGEGVLHYARKDGFLKWCDEAQFPNETIDWTPLVVDDEGIHLTMKSKLGSFDLVLDSASTHSILKQDKAATKFQCPEHSHYQCFKFESETKDSKAEQLFYLMDLPKEFKADGLLGDDYFRHHDVVIDNYNKRLGIITHKSYPKFS